MAFRLFLLLLVTTAVRSHETVSTDCSLETDGMCDSDLSEVGQEPSEDRPPLDHTIKKILIVGPTGAGKSSMANSLLGVDPQTENVLFTVCGGWDSCTKGTSYKTGKWLGSGPNFTVIDTPGLGDSDGEDPKLITDMLDVLKNTVKSVDAIVLLLKGTENRFNAGMKSMLLQMSSIFGDQFWKFLLIGVSFWKYDQSSIDDRDRRCLGRFCEDENWFKIEVQKQLEEKFYQTEQFEFAFIHSFSQTEYNKNDPIQQKHWLEETEKLWSFVNGMNETFILKGVDDILEDNRRLKRQVEEYENTIDTEIADLKGEIQTIKETHNSELNQLKDDTLGEIQTIKETHNSELNQLKNNTLVNKEELTQTIRTNKQELTTKMQNTIDTDISKIKADILNLSLTPVGTVIGWLGGKYLKIPPEWQKCDGGKIFSGPMKGFKTPNLNSGGYFLRGALTTDAWTIQGDMIRQHGHNIHDPGHQHQYYDWTWKGDQRVDIDNHDRLAADDERKDHLRTSLTSETSIEVKNVTGATAGHETRPKNIAVEWIIKIV